MTPRVTLVALALAATAAATATITPHTARAAAEERLPAVLSLETALAIARRNQPDLRQARANVEAAQARVDQARAGLLPQVNEPAVGRAVDVRHRQLLSQRSEREPAAVGLRSDLAPARRRAGQRRRAAKQREGDRARD